MKKITSIVLLAVAACSTPLLSCKKDAPKTKDCFADLKTYRQLEEAPAFVAHIFGQYCIIEIGTIDTRLIPCNLPPKFQVHNLPITVSGEVKFTTTSLPGPCCAENFVISKIKKRR